MDDGSNLSRRRVLKVAVVAAGAGLAASVRQSALAQQKASKEAMKYQDKPNGNMQCDNCSQFEAPNSCKVVEGTISPTGYCIAWVKKA
jgi:hypothetical protein